MGAAIINILQLNSIVGSESLCGTSFSACNRIYSSGSAAGVSWSCCCCCHSGCCCFPPFCCCCFTLLPASSTDCLESLFMSALIYATVRISALCIFRECLCVCECVCACVWVCVCVSMCGLYVFMCECVCLVFVTEVLKTALILSWLVAMAIWGQVAPRPGVIRIKYSSANIHMIMLAHIWVCVSLSLFILCIYQWIELEKPLKLHLFAIIRMLRLFLDAFRLFQLKLRLWIFHFTLCIVHYAI